MVGFWNWCDLVVCDGSKVAKCKMMDFRHLFENSLVVKIWSSIKCCCDVDHEIDNFPSFLETCECFSEHLAILGVQSKLFVSIGLFSLELLFPSSRCWVQETQPELDTFPRLLSLSMLPRLQFLIRLITWTLLLPDVMDRYSGLTVH